MKKIQFNLTDSINLDEPEYQRAAALLAVFQAARLLLPRHIAQQTMQPQAYAVLYQSVFVRDYDSVLDVYGGQLHNLLHGAEAFYLSSSFQRQNQQSVHRFIEAKESLEEFKQVKVQALLILRLQKKMFSRRRAVEQITHIMTNLHEQEKNLATDKHAMQQFLAEQLQQLFSGQQGFISKRLLTNQQLLQRNPHLATQAYCALFAGVRAAYMWRQLGGGVLKDVFWRAAANPVRLFAEMHR